MIYNIFRTHALPTNERGMASHKKLKAIELYKLLSRNNLK